MTLGPDRRGILADGGRSSEIARAAQATVQATLDRLAPAYPLAQVSSWVASRRRGASGRFH
jgi:hypothetical protein